MTTSRSLLAQLSRRLTHRTEDIAVEAIGHILSNSEACRSALSDLLRGCGTDLGTISRVETQYSGESGERPDLAAFDEHRVERILIEAKFWAGLTGNQPVTYLERLPKDTSAALLVVAPAQRLETLWEELRRRVSEAESIDIGGGQSDSEVRYSVIGSRRLIITSWRNLLTGMAAQANAAGDVQTVNDIQQLQSLAEQEDSEAFLPLRPEQLSSEFSRLLPHLYRLIDDTVNRLREKKLASTANYQFTSTRTYSVQYMSFCDVPGAALGIDFGGWRWQDQSPIWLELRIQNIDSGIVEKLRQEFSPGFREGYWFYIPIRLKIGVEYDDVLDCIVEQLERIAAILKPESV